MDEDVLKKVCKFLQTQKDKEALFAKFWEGTNEFYPSGLSKTKVRKWLKEHPERFEIIANEKGDPFGKIKLKMVVTSDDLPPTSKNQDKKITQKLIECIDNTAENGHLFSNICKNKAQIFPEKLQDKKYIRKWLIEHENCFTMIKDANGGLFSVEVLDKARNLKQGRSMPPATEHNNLMQMDDDIAQKISQRIKNEGYYIPFESLLEAKDVIFPLSNGQSLRSFLESFSSKFEIVAVEGLGEWVHLKNPLSNAIGKVTGFIFENGGTVPFEDLLKHAVRLIDDTVNTPEALSTWLKANAGVYDVFLKPDNPNQPWQVKVNLGSPRFCQNYVTRGQCEKRKCPFLHICKTYVCRPQHSNEPCELSHHVRDAHNTVIVEKMGALSKETDEVIVKVLRKSCFPRVCSEYMSKNGECKNGDKCHFLHICGNYVLNQCSGHCPLSHQVADGRHNIELLKRYAMLPSKNMSEEIVKINIAFVQAEKPLLGSSDVRERFAQVKKPQPYQSVEMREKKKRSRPRRRKKKSDQASSTVDDGSSADTDSTGGDFDNQSVASSSDNTKPFLSSGNIQKSNLATSLTGHQKVESWFGSPASSPSPAQAVNESCKQSDTSSNVSHPTSMASTKSSFWHGDLQKKVFVTILEKYNGSAPFPRIVKQKYLFGCDINIVKWFETFPQKFILHKNGQGKIDTVSVFSRKSRLCLDYSGKHGCDKSLQCGFFHICRDHVQGHCPKGNTCPLNHNVNYEQVTEAAKSMGLQDLTHSQLYTLIRVSVPAVCYHYNQGHCNRGVFCPNLHICKKFVKGHHCPANVCKLGHELKQDPAMKILKMYQLWSKQPNVSYIRKMIFVFDTRKQSSGQIGGGCASEIQSENLETTDEARIVSGLMDVDLTEKVDSTAQEPEEVPPSICPKFLLGQRHKKCKAFHFGLPYCWQFKSPSGSWDNFDKSDCENMEKYFCDVNCYGTELNISTQIAGATSSICLDFQAKLAQTSAGDDLRIRRLNCKEKGQDESEAWYHTRWTWYKLESSKWVQFDATKVSLSDVMEGKIDRSSLRCRPAIYITESQVEEKKRALQEQQTSEAPASPTPRSPASRDPPQSSSDPARENIPSPSQPASASCHRTRVEQDSKDYKEVEKLLRDCVGQADVVVKHIDKIINDDLWEKHKSKKKSMTDELRPGEHLNECRLFVPCLYEDLERIMKGNVHLSRIDLPKPFGPGHYFTSDASLCLNLCRENFTHSRFLIVCQVLLGTYTHASPGLTEFPRRPNGRFYDSLVDKVDNPTVFVLHEKDHDQCYPAFIVDFSYTPARPQNEVDETLRSSEGNHGLTTQPQHFYPRVSQALPVYHHEAPRIQASTNPLSTNYVLSSTNLSPVVAQQPQMTPDIPTSADYVKAAPPYSERPPPQQDIIPSDPPPGYTPYPQSTHTASADLQHPGNIRQTSASRLPRKEDKCLVM